MTFVPSKYQIDFWNAIEKSNDNIFVSAVPGSGKTTSLVEGLKRVPRYKKTIFLAFSKAIQLELKNRVPDHVDCMTLHSLGYKALWRHYKTSLKLTGYKTFQFSKDVVEGIEKPDPNFGIKKLSSKEKLIYKFTISDLIDMARINLDTSLVGFKYVEQNYDILCKNGEVENAIHVFDKLSSYNRKRHKEVEIDYVDMLYLPIQFNMELPKYDFVAVDECNDLSNVQLELISRILKPKGRIIGVGDKNQCLLPSTKVVLENGSEKEIKDLSVGESVITAKGNGLLMNSKITDVFSKYIEEDIYKIELENGSVIESTKDHTHFASYTLMNDDNYYVYLMYKDDVGFRIGTSKNRNYRYLGKSWNHRGFASRMLQEGADKVWVLKVCDTLVDSLYYEKYYAAKYSIPTIVFRERGDIFNQKYIDKLFKELDTVSSGLSLLKDFGISFKKSHYVKTQDINGNNFVNLALCYDSRSGLPFHFVGLSVKSEQLEILKKNNIEFTYHKKKYYRIRRLFSSYEEAFFFAKKISFLLGLDIKQCAKFTKEECKFEFKTSDILQAGMGMFVYLDGKISTSKIKNIEKVKYCGYVYDINIERTHNFIANGIFTHNCIFGFAGANVNAIENMQSKFNMKELPLSITYRLPKIGVKKLQRINPSLEGSETAIEGKIIYNGNLLDCEEGDLVICRNTKPLIIAYFILLEQEKKVTIVGKEMEKGLLKLIKSYDGLNSDGVRYTIDKEKEEMINVLIDQGITKPEKHWKFIIFAEKVEILLLFLDRYKEMYLVKEKIEEIFDEKKSGIKLMTVHKSKGLEADRVFFITHFDSDKLIPSKYATTPEQKQQELNLLYVGESRFKREMHYINLL